MPRPPDYIPPPPPTGSDVARTLHALATKIAPQLARLATKRTGELPTSTTVEGLSRIRAIYEDTLRCLSVELEVLRNERVPAEGGLVLMWNQETHLDHLVLPPAIPRPFFSLYNNAVARAPYYDAHMRATGHIHVDQTDQAQWRSAVARAAERVRDGECVLVSPEGTRSWDGRLLPMKRGAFILAASSERPIVCVTVIGGHARLPRGSFCVRAGRMRVVFSDPIANDGDARGLAEKVAATFDAMKREHAI